ncbi:hypothetical protein J2S21_002748 [Peribacillus cavernae]|nr:hypothetical protein [Peribacillus cavernae]
MKRAIVSRKKSVWDMNNNKKADSYGDRVSFIYKIRTLVQLLLYLELPQEERVQFLLLA